MQPWLTVGATHAENKAEDVTEADHGNTRSWSVQPTAALYDSSATVLVFLNSHMTCSSN